MFFPFHTFVPYHLPIYSIHLFSSYLPTHFTDYVLTFLPLDLSYLLTLFNHLLTFQLSYLLTYYLPSLSLLTCLFTFFPSYLPIQLCSYLSIFLLTYLPTHSSSYEPTFYALTHLSYNLLTCQPIFLLSFLSFYIPNSYYLSTFLQILFSNPSSLLPFFLPLPTYLPLLTTSTCRPSLFLPTYKPSFLFPSDLPTYVFHFTYLPSYLPTFLLSHPSTYFTHVLANSTNPDSDHSSCIRPH